MNLRQQAEANLAFALEDDVSGFGWPVTLTETVAEGGAVHSLKGQVHRIGVDVDPATGLLIAGNKSAVTVRLSSIGKDPAKGWRVATTDITGTAMAGVVVENGIMLDKALGMATLVFKRSS